jgi:hypothetical protein
MASFDGLGGNEKAIVGKLNYKAAKKVGEIPFASPPKQLPRKKRAAKKGRPAGKAGPKQFSLDLRRC